ncbi:MAG: GTPase ObgE [Armatimonadetes bacterium]|nr:GTPase ObgE [Armatimonadota bacterium]
MFLDQATVELTSGKGGDGAVTFHREKHVPRGGPNGADGGKGGDVWLIADRNKRTLYDFRLHARIKAESGGNAHGNKKGKDAVDIEIHVPVGTMIFDFNLGSELADLSFDGARYRVCKGGRGGHGNMHYVSSVRQAPKIAEKGEPAEERTVRLELKLLADIGLVGLPNAGKSTLISQISAAKPKIADYPFTTLEPNLGVVSLGEETFTVADLPGLIEGAHEGHGLGDRFLKHAERCAALVHVVDILPIDGSDPLNNYELIESELKSYAEELWRKPRIVALNKTDLMLEGAAEDVAKRFESVGHPLFRVSAASGSGIQPLLYAMLETLKSRPASEPVRIAIPTPAAQDDDAWEIVEQDGIKQVLGKKVERWVAMTDMESDDSVRYLHKRLERLGVIERLRELGAEEGETILIGDWVFDFSDEA